MGRLRCPCGHVFSDSEAMHIHRGRDREEYSFHSWRSYQLTDIERAGMLPDGGTHESERFHESLYRMLALEGELWECPNCGSLHLRRPGDEGFHSFRPDA
jgi:hypothetical protein